MYLLWYEQSKKKKKMQGSLKQFIAELEKDVQNLQINYDKVFQVHKAPKKLKFIRKNTNISSLLFELRFMELYDYGSFLTLVVYLEFFLKFHYGVMIGKYPYDHYIQVIKDLRHEILNISKAFIFSVSPRSSTLKHIKDLDQFMKQWHDSLVSLTNKYLVILNNKYLKNKPYLAHPPYEYESYNHSQYYEMY
jgi:hypothetical protein